MLIIGHLLGDDDLAQRRVRIVVHHHGFVLVEQLVVQVVNLEMERYDLVSQYRVFSGGVVASDVARYIHHIKRLVGCLTIVYLATIVVNG